MGALPGLIFFLSVLPALPGPPNVVLLMGDDHGWEEVGYNGHPLLKTPTLDKMAAEGLRMDRFYSAHPSCSPTRGSVLTGRHPNRYGTFHPGCSLRPEEISVASLLKKAGYATAHFGKWHVGPVKASSPTNPGAMGFDEWLSHDNFFELDPVLSRNGGEPKRYEGEGSEVIVDEAIRFIDRSVKTEDPFLVVIWFGSPHEPYQALEEDLALYEELPDDFPEREVALTSNETGKRVKRPLKEVIRERFAEITAMDRAIGKLRDHLKSEGLHEDTILWYCGDNGIPPSGLVESRFRALKGSIYEGGTRVPGVIEWPARIKQPQVSKVNAVTSDMLPTLCELAGVPLPERPLDGISLVPMLDGTMKERGKPICFWDFRGAKRDNSEPYIDPELQKGTTPLVKLMGGKPTRDFANSRFSEIRDGDFAGARAILDGRYKLFIGGGREGEAELYDLVKDPGERSDLAKGKPELAGKLRAQLTEWQESVLGSLLGEDYP
ncbi:sulfatase [Haloferula sp. A504]|uniref:sulfatase n=1 Tax=Haloferula sp. A504 TaxID=3373601 RepID=UPI0031C6FB80|nr:sulfatase-like hydrolase/transferase [Verrucomicrobiaceae bacterium E54]